LPESEPLYRIRTCREGDLDDVLTIEEETFTDAYDREIFSQLLTSEPQGFLVAADDSGVLGYVASSGRYGLVFSLAVSAAHRRRGIGQSLMVAVLGYLRGETKRVSLQVRVTNSAAIGLYHQFSFKEQGRIRRYYPDGEDALVMILDFRPA
jgi:[ribosomal protein S18]-alanine N-acetyltransferase